MVFLDNTLLAPRESSVFQPRLTGAVLIALGAFTIGMAGFALRGFDIQAWRFGAQLVWRFEMLVFFAALVAGPLGRLTPLRWLADKRRPLLQGFCAAMGVHIAFILLAGLFTVPDGIENRGLSAGTSFFILFNGCVAMAMAAAVNRRLCSSMGESACRAMLGISAIYFWLCFGLIGLAHITGPHRHDVFYELSVILMVVALLARFADRFFESGNPAARPG